jgi:hypothetical protein
MRAMWDSAMWDVGPTSTGIKNIGPSTTTNDNGQPKQPYLALFDSGKPMLHH